MQQTPDLRQLVTPQYALTAMSPRLFGDQTALTHRICRKRAHIETPTRSRRLFGGGLVCSKQNSHPSGGNLVLA